MKHQMKFVCIEKREAKYAQNVESYWTLIFTAQYDNTIDEDKRFSVATPSGRFEVTVAKNVSDAYELGKAYYFYSADIE